MPSTNEALAAAGYTTAPSPSYGCKLILKGGQPIGHFDCATAFDLPGMREREAAVDAALAAHSANRVASRHFPSAERRAARRASSAAAMAAIDEAHAVHRAGSCSSAA